MPAGNAMLRRTTNSSGTTMTVYRLRTGRTQLLRRRRPTKANIYYYSLAGTLARRAGRQRHQFYLTDALGSVLVSFSNAAGREPSMKGNQVFGPYGNTRYYPGHDSTPPKASPGSTTTRSRGWTTTTRATTTRWQACSSRRIPCRGNAQGMNPYGYVGGNPETRE